MKHSTHCLTFPYHIRKIKHSVQHAILKNGKPSFCAYNAKRVFSNEEMKNVNELIIGFTSSLLLTVNWICYVSNINI